MNQNDKTFANLNKKTKIFFVLFIIGVSIVATYVLFEQSSIAVDYKSTGIDLQNHPIYSQYTFNQDDTILNIGIQPLYLPTGIIFEALKRDTILAAALLQLNRKIRYFPFLKGADLNFFLRKGLLDGGVGGDMPALSASSTLDLFIPVRLQKGNASIVSAKPMLTNDMKGRRIAYPLGSIAHYFLLDLLQSAGISKNEVTLIPMEVSSMAEALHDRKIDAFSAWEPTVASAMKQYPEFYIPYRKITTGYLYFSQDVVTTNQEAVSHILAAVIRAIRWMKSDLEPLVFACQWNIMEMEQLTGEKSFLTANEIAKLALQDIFRYSSLNNSIVFQTKNARLKDVLHEEYKFLLSLDKIPEKRNWEQVFNSFDDSLILEILSSPRKYHLNEFDYDTSFKENYYD